MSPIRSLGNKIASFRNRFGNTGLGAALPFIGFVPVSATGGETFTHGGYKYHFFKNTGPNPFNVSAVGDVQYLLVGGGGGAGANNGGGGGGGALYALPTDNHPVTVQDYTIVVGTGGPGATGHQIVTGKH